jgi:hypothetical protein
LSTRFIDRIGNDALSLQVSSSVQSQEMAAFSIFSIFRISPSALARKLFNAELFLTSPGQNSDASFFMA